MTTKLTLQNLKSVTKSPEFKTLITVVLATKLEAQLIRETVNSYAVPLFTSMNFVRAARSGRRGTNGGEPILNPEDAYLSNDEQLFAQYIELLHSKHLEHGFAVEYGYCPALIAEHKLRKAENELLKFMEKELGLPPWKTLEDRQKFLDLFLRHA